MASKRKSLCVDEKVLLIRAIEAGETISGVGRRFGFSCSTVSTIWKNKEKILQAKKEGKSSKKIKRPKYEDLDQVMLLWINRQHHNKVPVSGPIIKAKAERFAKELGLSGFKASEGWLGKFKQRHHINSGKTNKAVRIVDTNVSKPKPSNVLQATDQSASNTLNNHREKLLKEVVKSMGKTSINMLHAVNCLTKAWEEETTSTQHFSHLAGHSVSDDADMVLEIETEDDLTELVQEVKPQNLTGNLQTTIKVDKSFDESSLTEKNLDLVTKPIHIKQEHEDGEITDSQLLPSINQALDATKLLYKYFLYHQDDSQVCETMKRIYEKMQLDYQCTKN